MPIHTGVRNEAHLEIQGMLQLVETMSLPHYARRFRCLVTVASFRFMLLGVHPSNTTWGTFSEGLLPNTNPFQRVNDEVGGDLSKGSNLQDWFLE